jgi:RNA polymerase sigma-70 factor (sigma-E family)
VCHSGMRMVGVSGTEPNEPVAVGLPLDPVPRPPTPFVDVRNRDVAALYAEHHARLVRLAYLIVGSATAAEDVTQEAFAKLHERIDRIDNPGGWLRTVVVNGARNEVRRLGARRRLVERLRSGRASELFEGPPELIASLRRLPVRQRAVIVLRFYEDLAEADIAATLGMRIGTVKSSLHRGLAALRDQLGTEEL